MKYDVQLKAIFQEAMPGLLRLLKVPAVKDYLTVEFPKPSHALPDLVLRLVDGRILHLELQSTNDPRIALRCLEYRLLINRKWPGEVVLQWVIYVGAEPLTMRSEIDEVNLRYGVPVIDLQQVPAAAFLDSEGDAERALAVLCATGDPRETIGRIVGSWKHLPPEKFRANLAYLSLLSQLRKRDKIVEEVTDTVPIEIDIRENAFYKRAEREGEVRGEARGEARGLALGEARGEVKLLIRILERRFGALPDSVRSRIASETDTAVIEAWADHSITASSLDEVFG